MNLPEDQPGITKNLIASKVLIENSRRIIKQLEAAIMQRQSRATRHPPLMVSSISKEPPNQSGSVD